MNHRRLLLQGALDGLNLLAHCRQNVLFKAVELVEAAPGPAPHQPHEDSPHGFEIELFVAVEDEDLPPQTLPERLHGLGLPRAGGPKWVAAAAQGHRLGQRQVALISQGGVHQLRGVPHVLERILELCLDHLHDALPVPWCVVPKLLAPCPVAAA